MTRKKITVFFHKFIFPILGTLFLGVTHNVFAWTNPGFETGNLTGWTSLTNSGGNVVCNPSVSVVPAGPAIDTVAGQLNEIHSGNNAVQLFSGRGDSNHGDWAQVSQTDTVPSGNGCLSFWFAGVFEDEHYLSGDIYGDAYMEINVIIGGATVATINYNWPNNLGQIILDGLTGAGNYAGCTSNGSFDWGYVPWTNYTINLSAYAGQLATLQATMYSCDASGHFGVAYLDDVAWSTCVPSTVTLTKSHSPTDAVSAGGQITYTLSYANPGGTGVAGVEINDTIPTGTSLVGGSVSSNPSIPFTSQVGQDIIWDIGYLEPGASGSLSFQVTAPNGCSAAVTNVAKETDLEAGDLLSNAVINDVTTCTPTATNTSTKTNTQTVTQTSTSTVSHTQTNTCTATCTNTNTTLNTATNTDTPTDTSTNSSTVSETFTMTSTSTNSTTATATNTCTVSSTHTNTSTSTSTPTSTFTRTQTSTETNSETSTNTPTNTHTQTVTETATSTATHVLSIGKIVSKNQVSGGDVLTYSIGITVTGNSYSGSVVTDTLPAFMNFVSFGTSPVGTTDNFNAVTHQLSWVLPSPLAPGIYQLTYQTQVLPAAPGNTPLTNFVQMSYSGSTSPLTASVPVTVLGQFTIKINIYNSAGEIVKTIVIQQFSQPINNISLSTTNRITTLQGPGSTIDIVYDGNVIGTWDGSTNAGQPVSNGTYVVQVDSISPTGIVTTVSQSSVVNRNLATFAINVFNSSGELVRELYSMVADVSAVGPDMTESILGSNFIRRGGSGTLSGQNPGSNVRICVKDDSGAVTLTWDGTNNSDNFVTPGVYTVQVHWYGGTDKEQVLVQEVIVLPGNGSSGSVVVRPNVLNATNGMAATFDATAVTDASSLQVQLYTLAGEMIQTVSSPLGLPQASWNASGMASGIYVAVITVKNVNGGLVQIERHKVMVLH